MFNINRPTINNQNNPTKKRKTPTPRQPKQHKRRKNALVPTQALQLDDESANRIWMTDKPVPLYKNENDKVPSNVVLSIDFGHENLSYWIGRFCDDELEVEFLSWKVISLGGSNQHEKEYRMIEAILTDPNFPLVTNCCFEQQNPCRRAPAPSGTNNVPDHNGISTLPLLAGNISAYGLSSAINAALYTHWRNIYRTNTSIPSDNINSLTHPVPTICFRNPCAVFKNLGMECPPNKPDKKKKAIKFTMNFFTVLKFNPPSQYAHLEKNTNNPLGGGDLSDNQPLTGPKWEKWDHMFRSAKKKDDLSDSFITGLSELMRILRKFQKSARSRLIYRPVLRDDRISGGNIQDQGNVISAPIARKSTTLIDLTDEYDND